MRFGRYRLLEDIGEGGMAVVSRAVIDGPRGFSREIVIKRILRELSSFPSFVRMLATEARLSARLRHPGIVQVHEFGEVDGEYYLAMELVDGADLRDVLQACVQSNLRLPVGVAAYVVAEVASALAYAHALTDDEGRALGIVHRDISPSNVMLTPSGTVKLLDFGIAHAEDHIREDQTRTTIGSLKGKLSYLSPEQADGRAVDGRSDIFSLGSVFYELLTTRRLFRGSSELDTMRLVREAVVTPPSAVVEDIPADVDAVVTRMLARDPAERYQSGDEVVAALTPIMRRLDGDGVALRRFVASLQPIVRRGGESSGRRPAAATRSGTSSLRGSYGEARTVTRRPLSRALRRWRAAWIAGGVVAALVAVLTGHWWHRRDDSKQATAAPAATAVTPPPAPTAWPAPAAAPATPSGAPSVAAAATTPAVAPPTAAPTPSPTSAPQQWLNHSPAPPAAVATPQQWLNHSSPAAVPAATPSALPAAAPPRATPPPAGAPVRLSVTGTEGAEVLVDGVVVGTVPLQTALPPLAGLRRLVVRRAGFKRWSVDIDGRKDAALVAPLARLGRKPAGAPLLKDPFQ